MPIRRVPFRWWLLGGLSATALAAVWTFQGELQALSLLLLARIEALGPWGPPILIGLEITVVVTLLPGVVLTLGGGYLFGFVAGTAYMMTGTTVGAIISFLIARYFFGERARRYILEHPRLQLLSDEFTPEAWKIVLLTRLIPFFPYKLSNYFFGLTPFRFGHFLFGTFFGLLPLTSAMVYLGSLAADLTAIGLGGSARSPAVWALFGLGLVAAVVAIVYVARHAHRALERYRPRR